MNEPRARRADEFAVRASGGARLLLFARAKERSRSLAFGFHSSRKKGSGIEFASYREYSPGDDLRALDRHALGRHRRLVVREFEREAARPVYVLVDASASMRYRSPRARESKLERAAFLAGCAAFVATRGRDPLGLATVGGERARVLPARSSLVARDAALAALSDALAEAPPRGSPTSSTDLLASVLPVVPPGATVLWLSDFFEDAAVIERAAQELATRGRTLCLIQVVDPFELEFPFQGALHFASPEDESSLVTHADRARAGYLRAFSDHQAALARAATTHGGYFAVVSTETEDERTLLELTEKFRGSARL